MLKINWNQVLTTVISTFFAAVIVSACAIMWKGATTVDAQVKNATVDLENTIKFTKEAVDLVEAEIAVSRDREERFDSDIEALQWAVRELQTVASPKTNAVRKTPPKKLLPVGRSFPKPRPPSIDPEMKDALEILKNAPKPVEPVESDERENRTPMQQQLPQWIYQRKNAPASR